MSNNFDHVRCPICYFILIEPVSLPCLHKLCLACFDKQVEEVNYTCPICRHRISNWARNVSRENSLVDEELWNEIQQKFPAVVDDHIRKKLSLGLLTAKCVCLNCPCTCSQPSSCDSTLFNYDTPEKAPVVHNFAKPGELLRDYQKEMQKVREEILQKRQEEIKANEEYILASLPENKRKKLKTFLQIQQQQTTTSTHFKTATAAVAMNNPAMTILPTNTGSSSKTTADSTGPVRSRSATAGASGSGMGGGGHGEDKHAFSAALYRSPSTSSIDSITPEVQGFLFKPIHCSPRTPPRRFGHSASHPRHPPPPPLPNYVSYPPVIRSVPRVLDGCDTSSESSFASSCSSMSNFRGVPDTKFRRRYPTRAAARRAVISMGSSVTTGGEISASGSSTLCGGNASPSIADNGALKFQTERVSTGAYSCSSPGGLGLSSKGGTLVPGDVNMVDLESQSVPEGAGLDAASSFVNQSPTCQSPTSATRTGRSSRLAMPTNTALVPVGASGNKRKQQVPEEKENKRGIGAVSLDENVPLHKHVEIPEFKRLRLNQASAAAFFQQSFEEGATDMENYENPLSPAALALSATSNNLDTSLFINTRRSGPEFLSVEVYKQFLKDREVQIKLDCKLAKDLSNEPDELRSASNSPSGERTYSLRKRKVNYKQ